MHVHHTHSRESVKTKVTARPRYKTICGLWGIFLLFLHAKQTGTLNVDYIYGMSRNKK